MITVESFEVSESRSSAKKVYKRNPKMDQMLLLLSNHKPQMTDYEFKMYGQIDEQMSMYGAVTERKLNALIKMFVLYVKEFPQEKQKTEQRVVIRRRVTENAGNQHRGVQ